MGAQRDALAAQAQVLRQQFLERQPLQRRMPAVDEASTSQSGRRAVRAEQGLAQRRQAVLGHQRRQQFQFLVGGRRLSASPTRRTTVCAPMPSIAGYTGSSASCSAPRPRRQEAVARMHDLPAAAAWSAARRRRAGAGRE
jgi:hypothetical protein